MNTTIKREQNKVCLGLLGGQKWIALLVAILMAPAGLMAQKVYKDVNNRVILDLTDMPPTTITNVKKYTGSYTAANVPTNGYMGGSLTISNSENLKPYEKLEIAPLDLNSTTTPPTLGAGINMNWQQAFLRCKELDYNGTGWRLPVHRELAMMYTFKRAFDAIFTAMGNSNSTALPFFITISYWDATESDSLSDNAMAVTMERGNGGSTLKTNTNRVRCVREVVTP